MNDLDYGRASVQTSQINSKINQWDNELIFVERKTFLSLNWFPPHLLAPSCITFFATFHLKQCLAFLMRLLQNIFSRWKSFKWTSCSMWVWSRGADISLLVLAAAAPKAKADPPKDRHKEQRRPTSNFRPSLPENQKEELKKRLLPLILSLYSYYHYHYTSYYHKKLSSDSFGSQKRFCILHLNPSIF